MQHFTLSNIVDILEAVLVKIKQFETLIQNDTLVVAIGNTGTGKSTLLSSLVFGPESLEPVKMEDGTTVI